MLTEEQLLKLKVDYAAWFEPGDEVDLSEVARDMTNLVDEVLSTRKRAEAAETKLATVPEYAAYHIEDSKIGPYTESFDDWYNRKKLPARE